MQSSEGEDGLSGSEPKEAGRAGDAPRPTRRQLIIGLAATAAAPFAKFETAKAMTSKDADASAVLDSIARRHMLPESATSLGLDIGPDAGLRFRLSDQSAAGWRRIRETVEADLKRAEAIDVRGLSFTVRTNVEVVRSAYRTGLEGFGFPYGDVSVGGYRNTPYAVIQNVGSYIDTPQFLTTDHPIENAADAEAYLSRLAQYPRQLDGEVERLKLARAAGVVPPSFLAEKTVAQLMIAAKEAQEGGVLAQSIALRTRQKGIPGNWEARARKIIIGEVGPALERQITELKAEQAVATEVPGMWARPDGEAYYRWALKAATTTKLPPEELHRLGLQQVRELHGRMDPILKTLGYTQGTIADRMRALANDPQYKFAEGDKGRSEIIAFIEQRLAIIRAVLPRAFATLVPGYLQVKRMAPQQEPGAPAAFGGAGSIDGKIPGKFWINLGSTDLHRKYDLPDLTAHEAIPGHVWQGEFGNKLPLIRTLLSFTAYAEGWALYAEQLVDELGVYDDFPAARLGYLQSIAFRACRLVVDTGLHAKRWSRQQAFDFLVNVNGSNPLEMSSEVDRYCAWPGQACAYKIGHNEINRLRDKARAELGRKFNLRQFDDALVLGGDVPMDVLAKNVGEYVARRKVA